MPEPVVIVVSGIPGVEASLRRLSGIDAQRVRQRAIALGARMTVPVVKHEAPVRTGRLQSRVGSFVSSSRTSGGFAVGRDPNSRIVGSMAPHRHLVIRGTGPRYTKGSRAYRGVMPSNPFVDRAWAAARFTVIPAMANYAAREVKKLWHG